MIPFSRPSSRRAVILSVGLVATLVGPVAPAPAAAPAPVARVASSSNGAATSRASITLARPPGTVAGHVMVASVVSNDAPAFSTPAGWQRVRNDSIAGVARQAVYVKVAGPAEPASYTWTLPKARRVAGGITTYAGVDTARPVDAHSALKNPGKGVRVVSPSITTTVRDTMLVHLAAINAEGSITPPAGLTERWEAQSPNPKSKADIVASSSDRSQVAAGATGQLTAAATLPGPRIVALLALRPAATPAPPTPAPPPEPAPPPVQPDPVLVGAGDIGTCLDTGDSATAALLDTLDGTVFTLGDNTYVNGTTQEYADCYGPTWGRHKARTEIAVAGNHDYNTPGAAGYYDYFGAAAGDPATGYYVKTIGAWQVIVLNSNCEAIGGCEAGSAQEQWLRQVLADSDAKCTVALWHHPYFSSGTIHRSNPVYQPFWQALYDHGAEVVLVASDHLYERFGFQTPGGEADAVHGLRQFTVGTGGRSHQTVRTPLPNSEVRNGGTYGVLKMTLHADSYDWQFVPEAGKAFTDSGTSACHGAPPR